MENKIPFAPDALTKIDQELLISQPVTWSTRIHLVIWYGLVVTGLIAGISFLTGNVLRNDYQEGNREVILGLMSFLAIVIWLVYLLRFNVFKRFGKWTGYDTLKTYLLYFISVLIFVSWPFVPLIVKTTKANLKYSSNELSRDINAINYKICQLEKDALDNTFKTDTLQVNENVKSEERVTYMTSDSLTGYLENYYLVNTDLLMQKLAEADSSRQLNDSVYVIVKYPDYEFIKNFSVWKNSTDTQYYSSQLFREVIRKPAPADRQKIRNGLIVLLKKYMTEEDIRYWGEPGTEKFGAQEAASGPLNKYHLLAVERNIDTIADNKYRFNDGGYMHIVRMLYYFSMVISLLIVIYRHISTRTFFLWVLCGFVLSIFTVLALSGGGSGAAFFGFIAFYYFLFLLIGLTVFQSGTQSHLTGISICFAVFITPFLPLLMTAAYYSSMSYRERLTDYSNEALHYRLAELAGFILLLILLQTVYRNMFKKWYASPKE